MLASTSDDLTAKLLDFRTGKIIYTGLTSDKSKMDRFQGQNLLELLVEASSVCFI